MKPKLLIDFNNVRANGLNGVVSFRLEAGSCLIVPITDEQEGVTFIRLLLGFQSPESGEVSLLDTVPCSLDTAAQLALRSKIGIIYSNGGHLSNLNAWENLMLQSEYHGNIDARELRENAQQALQEIGFSGELTALPAQFGLVQKRQLALARAMLSDSLVLVFQSTADGIGGKEHQLMLQAISKLLTQKPIAGAIFLTTRPESLEELNITSIITK